jgi:hypothetical protein
VLAIVCWRCEAPGHAAADCQPPPAENRKQLDKRITRLVERWQEFEITLEQKRLWINLEIRAYEKARKAA